MRQGNHQQRHGLAPNGFGGLESPRQQRHSDKQNARSEELRRE